MNYLRNVRVAPKFEKYEFRASYKSQNIYKNPQSCFCQDFMREEIDRCGFYLLILTCVVGQVTDGRKSAVGLAPFQLESVLREVWKESFLL